jgi:hypothetical protein
MDGEYINLNDIDFKMLNMNKQLRCKAYREKQSY